MGVVKLCWNEQKVKKVGDGSNYVRTIFLVTLKKVRKLMRVVKFCWNCVICFHTGYKRMKIGRLARLTKGDKVNRVFVSWGVVSLIVSKRIQGIWSIFVRDFLESIGWKDVRSGSSIWGDNHSRTLCLIHVDRPYIRLTKGVKVNHMFESWGVVSLILWKNKPTSINLDVVLRNQGSCPRPSASDSLISRDHIEIRRAISQFHLWHLRTPPLTSLYLCFPKI